MHSHDECVCRFFAGTDIGVRGAGIEIDSISGAEGAVVLSVVEFEFALEDIEELVTRMHVSTRLLCPFERNELRKVGVHVSIGDHVAEAFEVVRWLLNAGLRESDAVFATVNAEHGLRFRFKEVGEVL
jgi:hypothetical protein